MINGGFEKVERLEGNVGLLKFNGFVPPEFAGETAVAAMNFLASSDALIVDLRENGGGDPAMVALICSYLFGAEQVHLNDLYFRPANETQQYWTLSYVPGRRYEGKPVYVLTSNGRSRGPRSSPTTSRRESERPSSVRPPAEGPIRAGPSASTTTSR